MGSTYEGIGPSEMEIKNIQLPSDRVFKFFNTKKNNYFAAIPNHPMMLKFWKYVLRSMIQARKDNLRRVDLHFKDL